MSYGEAIAWLYCRRTCNRSLITSIVNTCATAYTATYSVPWYPRRILCSCAYMTCAASRDLQIQQWRLMWLSRIPSFPTASFIHVFIRFCLCSAGSMRKRGDEEMYHTVSLRSINSVCFARMFYRYCNVEELIGFREFVVLFKTPIPFSRSYILVYKWCTTLAD
jgi:hypothetical protein